jgi:hypothetical protein
LGLTAQEAICGLRPKAVDATMRLKKELSLAEGRGADIPTTSGRFSQPPRTSGNFQKRLKIMNLLLISHNFTLILESFQESE